MTELDLEITHRLEALHAAGLYRRLRRVDSPQSNRTEVDGQIVLNFAANDYLGLANHPALKAAAAEAAARFGAGAGASRLICGSLAPHYELEEALAAFKGAAAALTFASGYAAATGTIGALLSSADVIILDRLVHACLVDGARLCGAKIRVFAHNDLNDLERILRWAQAKVRGASDTKGRGQVLIVTESIFSMDGDQAPLREMVRLKEQYGAWLMVDEAHATGLYGESGRGLAEELQVSDQIDIHMGTLGKALGASGGYICGSRALIDYLINRARSFVFSTAPVPAAAAAASTGIRVVQSPEGQQRRALLWGRIAEFESGNKLGNGPRTGAIKPIMIGGEAEAVRISNALLERGIFIPPIRYPTVGRGRSRLRLTLTAAHTSADVEQLGKALRETVSDAPGTG
jgi:8-amino-7-oxononanoate synthase